MKYVGSHCQKCWGFSHFKEGARRRHTLFMVAQSRIKTVSQLSIRTFKTLNDKIMKQIFAKVRKNPCFSPDPIVALLNVFDEHDSIKPRFEKKNLCQVGQFFCWFVCFNVVSSQLVPARNQELKLKLKIDLCRWIELVSGSQLLIHSKTTALHTALSGSPQMKVHSNSPVKTAYAHYIYIYGFEKCLQCPKKPSLYERKGEKKQTNSRSLCQPWSSLSCSWNGLSVWQNSGIMETIFCSVLHRQITSWVSLRWNWKSPKRKKKETKTNGGGEEKRHRFRLFGLYLSRRLGSNSGDTTSSWQKLYLLFFFFW